MQQEAAKSWICDEMFASVVFAQGVRYGCIGGASYCVKPLQRSAYRWRMQMNALDYHSRVRSIRPVHSS
jgi:hypothetical protein